MKTFTIILLNLIFISPVFAGQINQQPAISTFSDQDLEKYKKASGPNLPQQHLNHDKNEAIENNPSERSGEVEDELSESEKKSIEREFNRIVASMLSQLKAGNIEGALAFFVESRKDRQRQIFKALKDNNTLTAAFEGYEGVDIGWIYNHLAECGFSRREKGKIYSYPIKFMEVAKGVWKIYDL